MTTSTQKKIGRPPVKAPTKTEKRAQIGFFVRADIKRQLMAASKLSGRTLSAEVEHLIERGLMADQIAKLSGTTQDAIYRQTLTAVMGRYGLAPVWDRDADGKTIVVDWERRKSDVFIPTTKEDQP
jgi:hypothetical protein